ncbi:hypothetical protein HCX48_04515 [Rhodocyclus tenuis]|uniref:Porin n=2 Tax=Rhodocyclus TaxID=1064 RepID=A0A6L5JXF9_RHOTE|nr:TorF family putative porin [Rhodocyclus gracilis]MQY51909.1 hypothetical protein [Rhodocyclus gracilis]MRD73402.1 hypothetical protein [Rhodocyclus gracilis]NJA88488.1 hypothetical protein [Rhodocyclus gracilis]
MKKTVLFGALCAAFIAPAAMVQSAHAEEAAADAAAAPALTANISAVTSYRFRGIDQTFGKPALQGGFDYAHSSGFYVGNWNSNVSSGAGYPDGNLEMDFYGGYKQAFGDFGIDVGAIYYYYPGSEIRGATGGRNNGVADNKEVYIGGSWKFLSLKYSYAVDDYFGARGDNGARTRGSNYLDLSANYDLGDGWGVNGHVGRFDYKDVTNGDYTDWKLGVTKDISGWVVGASYVGTNAKGDVGQPYRFSNSLSDAGNTTTSGSKSKDAGRGIAILSVSRTF